jgi:rubrerythrin
MVLSHKEKSVIQDLQTQEKECIQKYGNYCCLAKDPELKNLFDTIQQDERKHFETLDQVLAGCVPSCDCNDSKGKEYSPVATYTHSIDTDDKKNDCFLATDCIGSEKLVSGEYNNDVFAFEDSDVRKVLADIQIEEQNHAEMLYKYKKANGMQ